VAVGMQWQEADAVVEVGGDEATLLRRAWEMLGDVRCAIVGFNIRNFDLPWLWGRTGALGIEASAA